MPKEPTRTTETVTLPDGAVREYEHIHYPITRVMLSDGTVLDENALTPEQLTELHAYAAAVRKSLFGG